MGLVDYFRILKALTILFLLFVCMNYVPNQMGKLWKKCWQVSIQILRKQHWDININSKWPSLFCKFFKNLSLFLCHLVTHNREYYKWLCRLRRHIQVGRLPFMDFWLGLETQSAILGSIWPAGQTSNNSVLNIRSWRCPFPNGPSLAQLSKQRTRNSLCIRLKTLNMSSSN